MSSRLSILIGMIMGAAIARLLPHPWNFSPVAAMALFLPERVFEPGTRVYNPHIARWGTVCTIEVIGSRNELLWLQIDYDDSSGGTCNPNEVYLAGEEMRRAYIKTVPKEEQDDDEAHEGDPVWTAH